MSDLKRKREDDKSMMLSMTVDVIQHLFRYIFDINDDTDRWNVFVLVSRELYEMINGSRVLGQRGIEATTPGIRVIAPHILRGLVPLGELCLLPLPCYIGLELETTNFARDMVMYILRMHGRVAGDGAVRLRAPHPHMQFAGPSDDFNRFMSAFRGVTHIHIDDKSGYWELNDATRALPVGATTMTVHLGRNRGANPTICHAPGISIPRTVTTVVLVGHPRNACNWLDGASEVGLECIHTMGLDFPLYASGENALVNAMQKTIDTLRVLSVDVYDRGCALLFQDSGSTFVHLEKIRLRVDMVTLPVLTDLAHRLIPSVPNLQYLSVELDLLTNELLRAMMVASVSGSVRTRMKYVIWNRSEWDSDCGVATDHVDIVCADVPMSDRGSSRWNGCRAHWGLYE